MLEKPIYSCNTLVDTGYFTSCFWSSHTTTNSTTCTQPLTPQPAATAEMIGTGVAVLVIGSLIWKKVQKLRPETFLEAITLTSTTSILVAIGISFSKESQSALWGLVPLIAAFSLSVGNIEFKKLRERLLLVGVVSFTGILVTTASVEANTNNSRVMVALSFLLIVSLALSKNDPLFQILALAIVGPLANEVFNFPQDSTLRLVFSASSFLPLGVAGSLQIHIKPTQAKRADKFDIKHLAGLFALLALQPLAFFRSAATDQPITASIATFLGILGGASTVGRLWILLKERDREHAYEKQLSRLQEALFEATGVNQVEPLVMRYVEDQIAGVQRITIFEQTRATSHATAPLYPFRKRWNLALSKKTYVLSVEADKPLAFAELQALRKLADILRTVIDRLEISQEALDTLAYQARHDALTGLYNRSYFFEQVEKQRKFHQHCVVMFIDVDHFKNVNDTYGHEAGDKAIKKIASTIKRNVRASDLVARAGGDEFIVFIGGVEKVASLQDRIDKLLHTTLEIDSQTTIDLHVSIGVARMTAGDTLAEIIKKADTAMYSSKSKGGNTHTLLV